MQQSVQSMFQQNDTSTPSTTKVEQSNIAGNVLSVDHTETFMKYHYEHYTGVTLTIEMSKFA